MLTVDITGQMAGLGGADRLTGNALRNMLDGGTGNDSLWGLGDHDTLAGQSGLDQLFGGDGNDLLQGGSGEDRLFGGAGNDTLEGGSGVDVLAGGTGRDTLIGRSGADDFLFAERSLSTNTDTISDFTSIDRIVLENAVFTGLAAGALAASAFKALRPGAVVDSNDRLICEQSTGRLFFDQDGSGAAGRGVIAVLANPPTLTAEDF